MQRSDDSDAALSPDSDSDAKEANFGILCVCVCFGLFFFNGTFLEFCRVFVLLFRCFFCLGLTMFGPF